MPPKKTFKKSQNFEFFLKWGLRGSKNENFEKYLQNRKGLQKLGTKHVPHASKGKKNFEANTDIQDVGAQIQCPLPEAGEQIQCLSPNTGEQIQCPPPKVG